MLNNRMFSLFVFRVFLAKIKFYMYHNTNRFFKKYDLISDSFIKEALTLDLISLLRARLTVREMLYKAPVFGITFFYLVGFFQVLNQVKNDFKLTDGTLTVVVLLFVLALVIFSKNSLIRLVSFFLYWAFILSFFFKYLILGGYGIWYYYGYLLILIAVVRPLWNFLVEMCFFLLIKKVYHHSWFQKLLPYLSPNFDVQEMERELNELKKKQNDYKS